MLNALISPFNRTKMAVWAAKIERIVSQPPGSDEGFTAENIEMYTRADFSKMSTWEIVSEEMLDTQHPRIYFEHAHAELRRRGVTDAEIIEMRRFAWLTVGWFNFEKMLWEWCSLDERDIYRAIDWQFTDGWISKAERDRRIAYAKRYDSTASR